MFDDPKKELQRLQEKLLASEEEPWQPPEEDAETALESAKEMLTREAWKEPGREPLTQRYGGRAAEQPPAEEPVQTPGKKADASGLLALLTIELLALAGVMIWWLLCR